MLKKITSFFFVLLATLLLLAHTLIPHHHHETEVCIENTHCLHESANHEHNAPVESHRHDGDNANECFLIQALILPNHFNEQEFICFNSIKKQLESNECVFLFNSIDLDCKLMHLGNTQTFVAQDVFLRRIYSIFSLGLRAPPVV